MSHPQPTATCSSCGAQAPRDDMFGLEPELLCGTCANQVRERTRPVAVGRIASSFGGRPTPLTSFILGLATALFLAQYVVFGNAATATPEWLWWLQPWSPTGSIRTGDWWRLVTSALIHGGIPTFPDERKVSFFLALIHILFNSMWIWSLGRAVESTRGTLKFLLLFVGSAALASAMQVYFRGGGGVGLSGVLYGLAGYLWMRRREDAVAATVMNPHTTRFLGMWFALCWFIPMGIANWAHTGGLVWGLMAGWVSIQPAPGRYAGWVVLAMWTVWAGFYVCTGHSLR